MKGRKSKVARQKVNAENRLTILFIEDRLCFCRKLSAKTGINKGTMSLTRDFPKFTLGLQMCDAITKPMNAKGRKGVMRIVRFLENRIRRYVYPKSGNGMKDSFLNHKRVVKRLKTKRAITIQALLYMTKD